MSKSENDPDITTQEPPLRAALYRVQQERVKLYQEIVKLLIVLLSATLALAGAISASGLP